MHEIKHDGYRLMARREGATVRLLAAAAAKLRAQSFTLDGEDYRLRRPISAEPLGD